MTQQQSFKGPSIYNQPTWVFKAKLQHCEIWENRQCQLIAEAYPVWNRNVTRSHGTLKLPYVVDCLGIVGVQQKYLLLERIPNRLSEVEIINESQSLRVLYAAFKGLANLYPIFGYIRLNQACICFNQTGQVKIWINHNLSLVTPMREFAPEYNVTNRIIAEVIELVEAKSFNPLLFYGLKNKNAEVENLSFEGAAEYIRTLAESLFIDIRQNKPLHSYHSPQASRERSPYRNSSSHSHLNSPKNAKIPNLAFLGEMTPTNIPNSHLDLKTLHRRNKSALEHSNPNETGDSWKHNTNSSSDAGEGKIEVTPKSPRGLSKTRMSKFSPFNRSDMVSPIHRTNDERNTIGQCEVLEEQNEKNVEDSFSKNLKHLTNSSKKIVNGSGVFQTFGILEGGAQDHFAELDVAQMDAKIQQKLVSRSHSRKPSLEEVSLNLNLVRVKEAELKATTDREASKSGYPSMYKKKVSSQQYAIIDHKYSQYVSKNYPLAFSKHFVGSPSRQERSSAVQSSREGKEDSCSAWIRDKRSGKGYQTIK